MFFYEVSGWEVNILLILAYFIYNYLIFKYLYKKSESSFFANKR
jgi:hypothetical protein